MAKQISLRQCILAGVLILVLATSGLGFGMKAFKMREDFGTEPLSDCTQSGHIESAWRIHLSCNGPTEAEPAAWDVIKSMYG
jgi:hypothetical protein